MLMIFKASCTYNKKQTHNDCALIYSACVMSPELSPCKITQEYAIWLIKKFVSSI